MRIADILRSHKEAVASAAAVAVVYVLLLAYFNLSVILSGATVSGGDTGSMIYLAKYMENYLLPHFQITGWSQDRWMGFPIFTFQFPFPYILATLLSMMTRPEIAFNLVTILGIFSLPVSAFLFMRFLGFRFPTPAIASVFSLFLLFDEKNTIFGGNVASTLAGEFSYSISFSLMVLFLGFLYDSITKKRFSLWGVALYCMMLLSHVVTTVVAFLTSLFFIATRRKQDFLYNAKYLACVYVLSGLLLAFWLLPLGANLQYTTLYGRNWSGSIMDWAPQEAPIFLIAAVGGAILGVMRRDRRIVYIIFALFASLIAFFNGELLFAVNIRYWPMLYFFALMLAAAFAGEIFSMVGKTRKFRWMFLILPLILSVLATSYLGFPGSHGAVKFSGDWIKWNYAGYESKGDWAVYKQINDFVQELPDGARIWNDLADKNNRFGTPRAFEALPYFSGKRTIEGVYAQATISSPFISYVQCEMSSNCAGIPTVAGEERTTVHNLTAGAIHLAMMNVKYFIAAAPSVQEDLANSSDWKRLLKAGDWEVYELLTHNSSFVYVPAYEPNVIKSSGAMWKKLSLDWWVNVSNMEVPLVFSDGNSDYARFPAAQSVNGLKRYSIDNNCMINENIGNEEMSFDTNCTGKPHIIKVSYFPNWHVEGADRIYLVSPSFMLVYPKETHVRLYYSGTIYNSLGNALTLAGLALFVALAFFPPMRRIIEAFLH